jgi:hypothetical protein
VTEGLAYPSEVEDSEHHYPLGQEFVSGEALARCWSEEMLLQPAVRQVVEVGRAALLNAGWIPCNVATYPREDASMWPVFERVDFRHFSTWQLPDIDLPVVCAVLLKVVYDGDDRGYAGLTIALADLWQGAKPPVGLLRKELSGVVELSSRENLPDPSALENHVLTGVAKLTDEFVTGQWARVLAAVQKVTTP